MTEDFSQFQKLMQQGQFKEALYLAERQFLKKPGFFWMAQQAKALLRDGKPERALEAVNQALELEQNNPYSLLLKGDILLRLDRVPEALLYYQDLLGNFKVKQSALKGMLEGLRLLKEWEKILDYSTSLEMEESEKQRWQVAALKGLGRLEEALTACRNWLKAKPEHPAALWEMTELEVMKDGLENVLQRMARLVQIASLPTVYQEIYASLLRRVGQDTAALDQYTRLEARGAQGRVQRWKAFALAKNGREQEAIPLLEELLKTDPKDIYLHASYVAASRRTNQLARVVTLYETLLSLYPDEKTLLGRLAKIRKELK
jgi:tetratricopeptide (TPR) repeat protein